jgi:hypothetical protein
MELAPPLVAAVSIALTHFLAEELEELALEMKEEVVSFSSGISISYVFTELLPEFNTVSSADSIMLFPLLGFSTIHIVEKYVSKRSMTGEEAAEEYNEIHSAFLFVYYGAIGFLISMLFAENLVSGSLFILPILLHSAVSSLSFSELHEKASERLGVKLAVSAAPLIGVALHNLHIISSSVFRPVFGVVTGMFLYIAIRDSIPGGEDGKPVEFIVGSLIYLGVIVASRAL